MTHGPYDPDPAKHTSAAPQDPYGPRADGGAASQPHPSPRDRPLMHRVFDGRSVPDPGNPTRRHRFWIAAIALIALVTVMQQLNVLAHSAPKPVPTVEPVDPAAIKKPAKVEALGDDLDQADLAGRLMVKLAHAAAEGERKQLAPFIDPAEQPQLEHAVRVVPAYTELAGIEKGLTAINTLRDRIADDKDLSEAEKGKLSDDLDALTRLYSSGSDALSPADRELIEKRLGWQGKLALTFDKPDSDPQRQELTANGATLMVFLVLVGLGFLLVLVAGGGMFIWACVLMGTGRLRPRMDRPSLGGSLGIEEVVVFLVGFAGLKILLELAAFAAFEGWLGEAIKAAPEATLTPISLGLQWIILPMVVFYPRLRGYQRWRVKRALGWHRGEGFLREMGAGIAAYLACVPLYLLAAVLAFLLGLLEHFIVKWLTGKEPSGPVNPIGGLLAESWWIALLVGTLATVWAPIVEETVFRGALFRQLYARMGLVAAALISGTVFAMMHGYSPSLFPPLIVLGAGFAIIRWWRGSLVASVTAHALHNGTLMIILMVLFSLLK